MDKVVDAFWLVVSVVGNGLLWVGDNWKWIRPAAILSLAVVCLAIPALMPRIVTSWSPLMERKLSFAVQRTMSDAIQRRMEQQILDRMFEGHRASK